MDTGINLKDEDLKAEQRAVKQYRAEQGFDGDDLDPLKKRKAFHNQTETSTSDSCGHGTHLALLLLRYAPDADLYIAKVSSGMEFQDKNAVVNVSSHSAHPCIPRSLLAPLGHHMGDRR